jgi:cytochrome c-type biogenesis protein CcmH
MRHRILVILCLLCSPPLLAGAIDVYEFDSERDKARFHELTHQLRCPKCQNQSISDSDADISQDMRARVAEMIRAGKSDREIVDYFVTRYGVFVNYKPPMRGDTAFIWLGPVLVFLAGIGLVIWQMRRAARRPEDDE